MFEIENKHAMQKLCRILSRRQVNSGWTRPFTRDSLPFRLSPFFLSRYPHEAKTFPLQLQPAVNTTVHKGEVVV